MRHPRAPQRRRSDVVAAVRELHEAGLTRADIAARLGMDPGCRGSLQAALRRAGETRLLHAITPPDWQYLRSTAAATHGRDGRFVVREGAA